MSIITIVGAGMMGSAMSFPARDNGHEVRLVGTPLDRGIIDHARRTGEHLTLKRRLPEGIRYYQIEQLEEALSGADMLLGGVSSFGVDWFVENILPVIPEDLPVLSITKGMMDTEDGRLIPYPHLYRDRLAAKGLKRRLNAVGGPCTSYELADHDPTEVCFCGDEIGVLRWYKRLFETDYYHISLSTDVVGVECAVAMKNAYALGVSLAIGLSERIISLTIVTIGTSLPELVTTITAAKQNKSDLLVGNIIGSNIFNICFVLALPVALVGSINSSNFEIIDLIILIFSSLLLCLLARHNHKITRLEGILMLLVFVVYYGFIICTAFM